MNIEEKIKVNIIEAFQKIYNAEIPEKSIQIQKTRKEFIGDFTVVVFPFLRFSKKSPEQTAEQLGIYLKDNFSEIKEFNVIKGFLNLKFYDSFWLNFLNTTLLEDNYGFVKSNEDSEKIMIEYSSPNTNKPLHLGHIRNNLLGYSIAQILKANGKNVVKVNLVNDRGIHICKSMLAWQKWGNGETPDSTGLKGDKLVGNYYVKFDQEYKKQIADLINKGISAEEAKKQAPLLIEAQNMLLKWERKDADVLELWKKMNAWVYKGFDETYNNLGIDFDKVYYESETYLLGKSIVAEGLKKGVLNKKEDGSVWADLTKDGLDEKLLLRADGTSVYMTQDIGTANQRFAEYNNDKLIYVVGNEQNYHFQVLALVLKKLGFSWADNLFHLSYGMVELPEGKMKSREGTVVDADDLLNEMIETARETSEELGKLDSYSKEEVNNVVKTIALGALKYFMLKVDPKKNMLFNPKESIDFNGNTGPFIQYSYARIKSILNKAKDQKIEKSDCVSSNIKISEKEVNLIKLIFDYPATISEAADNYSPALIANYIYDLAKEFNQFYHDCTILKEPDNDIRNFRLLLSQMIGDIIKSSMSLLGINVPDRM
ncbi:MAG: arginine--tRNA ligase [Bacteroidales bacterium]|nr:arginine--tRNA ligase [Bacteroidales bacterium]